MTTTRRTFVKALGATSVAAATAGVAGAERPGNAAGADLSASLTGGKEVPPVGTGATGFASFSENDDGTLDYAVTLKNIENVTQGHIHHGVRGTNGPVVAFLLQFTETPAGGAGDPQDGTPQDPIVVEGTVEDTEVVSNVLADPSAYYVNVHTTQTPSGEVRGQIRATGAR